MKIYAFIFGRGGSKEVSGKNIREICGKPLLAYSIEQAREINKIKKIFVSTDDAKIASIATKYGADVIDRPSEIAKDDSNEWLAWKHAIEWTQEQNYFFDTFLSLPTTAPLRNRLDIIRALKKLDVQTDVVITMTQAARNPWFNMVTSNKSGYIEIINKNKNIINRRQDAPLVYDLTTIAYVTRPEFILSHDSIFEGRVRAIEIPRERAVDIDSELDLEFAEFLIRRQYKKKGKNNVG